MKIAVVHGVRKPLRGDTVHELLFGFSTVWKILVKPHSSRRMDTLIPLDTSDRDNNERNLKQINRAASSKRFTDMAVLGDAKS